MEFGLAVSGVGRSGLWAHLVVRELAAQGLRPGLIACSGSSALSLLSQDDLRLARVASLPFEPLRRLGMQRLAGSLRRPLAICPLPVAVCCLELHSRRPVVYTAALPPAGGRLRIRGGSCARAALSALRRHSREGRPCDYAAALGVPLAPLKAAGMGRILSVLLLEPDDRLPAIGEQTLLRRSTRLADMTLEIELGADPRRLIRQAIARALPVLWERFLF